MKTLNVLKKSIYILLGIMLIFPAITAQSQPEKEKTLSPYFIIPEGNPETDRIPLLSTSADVNIAGVIADVVITQVYHNEGQNPIEAIYVFPASTRAAVYSMRMTIGERVIKAKIQESAKAREAYEIARANGQTASLLEQERPNVFSMNVANIMPGDRISVELHYTELLIPEAGVYEFVYPTVVGPRYSNSSEDIVSNNDNWVKNPYTSEGIDPLYLFDFKASISAGLPIQEISCNSHEMDINYDNPSLANISLEEGHANSGNRDMILRYRLAGGKIETGLLLFEGEEENFFLAMIQPPKNPRPDQIPPREYVFIVDVSGSMNGFPLDVSKKLMKNLLGNLRSGDRFNILLFAGISNLMAEKSLEATESNIRKGIDFIDRQQGGGGTELLPALKRALALQETEDFARSFVIVTDGYVSVEREAFDLIRSKLGEASFFPFGIGSSVNRYLIEGMAHAGMGSPFIIESEEYASATADKFRKYIASPVLTNISTQFRGFEAYDIEPLSMADVFAERPLLIYGKWKGEAEGSINIRGQSGSGFINKILNVSKFESSDKNSALTYLWAREKIRVLDDYASLSYYENSIEAEVTALGLKYNLLTQYTSFIAIDNQVRNADGTFTTLNQPLPLPQGVSNYALGGVPSRAKQQHKTHRMNYGSSQTIVCEEVEMTTVQALPTLEDRDDLLMAETMAEYTGSNVSVEEFIKNNMIYPSAALLNQIEGLIYVSFIVETDGNISDIEIVSSTDAIFEQEALRLIQLTNKKWSAAESGGVKVKSKMILAVSFELN